MKAMKFQDDIPTFQTDNAKGHTVPLFDLTSMQDAGDDCHYPELVGEPHWLKPNCAFTLENVAELVVLGERMSSVATNKTGVDGKNL